MKGGRRKGSGRKPTGFKTVMATFSLTLETAGLLAKIESGKRSRFIDAAIRQAIERIN